MDKELRFIGTLDTSQLDQQFASITQKMKAMQQFSASAGVVNKMAGQGGAPAGVPNLTQYQEQKFKTYIQDMNKSYADTQKALKAALDEHTRIKSAIESQKKETGDYNEELQETLRLKKELAKSEENIDSIQRNQAQNLKAQNVAGGGGAGSGGGGAVGGMMGSIMKAASVGTAVMVAKQIGDWFTRREVDITRLQGSAIAGTAGTVLSQMQSGQFAYEGMFGEERARAAKTAKTAESRGRGWDLAQMLGGGALTAGGAALSATGAGAVFGVPMMAAGAGLMYHKSNMLDKNKYEAEKAAQYANDFNESFQSEKEQSAFKKDAIEKLQANAGAYLNYQRTLNLSDNAMFANFGNITKNGFTDQMGMQAANSILGAGGSTAMANQSVTALQAERGLGLTNAPQLLGMISGTQGIPETSKKTLIDIFAQGQSIGLDSSKYAQENRQFMQNVAESVSKGGTTSESAADTIAKIMGAFTGGATTMKGVEYGKTAYETFQKGASTTSGYQGAINMAGLLSSNPAIRKIKDPAILQGLANLRPEEIDPDDPYIQSAAAAMGISSKELANTLINQKTGSVGKGLSRNAALSRFAGKEKKWKESHGGTLVGFDQDKNNFGDSDFASLVSMHQVLNPGESLKAAEASIKGLGDLSTMTDEERLAKFKTQAAEKMENPETGRAIDKILRASATNAQTALQTLSDSINAFAKNSFKAAQDMGGAVSDAKIAQAALHDAQVQYNAAEAKLKADQKKPAIEKFDYTKDYNDLSDAAAKLRKTQEAATAATKAIPTAGTQ